MLWFVTPAHGRPGVTQLALEQRADLIERLELELGVQASCVVVACDENLELAGAFGFPTVELGNDHLGERVNAGIRFACREGGATHVAYIGSDNWLHDDVLADGLPDAPTIVTGRRTFVVDLERRVGRRAIVTGRYGVPPWIVPRALLDRCGHEPILPEMRRRIDGQLARGLEGRYSRGPDGREPLRWEFRDPHDLARVGFKCDPAMTSYARMAGAFGVGPEVTPWRLLETAYPGWLVDLARAKAEQCEHALA